MKSITSTKYKLVWHSIANKCITKTWRWKVSSEMTIKIAISRISECRIRNIIMICCTLYNTVSQTFTDVVFSAISWICSKNKFGNVLWKIKKNEPGKFPSAVQIKLFRALFKHKELSIGKFPEQSAYSKPEPFTQYGPCWPFEKLHG